MRTVLTHRDDQQTSIALPAGALSGACVIASDVFADAPRLSTNGCEASSSTSVTEASHARKPRMALALASLLHSGSRSSTARGSEKAARLALARSARA